MALAPLHDQAASKRWISEKQIGKEKATAAVRCCLASDLAPWNCCVQSTPPSTRRSTSLEAVLHSGIPVRSTRTSDSSMLSLPAQSEARG